MATVTPLRPNLSFASRGRIVRSWPIIPPTSALTPTSRLNWARLARSPSRVSCDPFAGIRLHLEKSAGVGKVTVPGRPATVGYSASQSPRRRRRPNNQHEGAAETDDTRPQR